MFLDRSARRSRASTSSIRRRPPARPQQHRIPASRANRPPRTGRTPVLPCSGGSMGSGRLPKSHRKEAHPSSRRRYPPGRTTRPCGHKRRHRCRPAGGAINPCRRKRRHRYHPEERPTNPCRRKRRRGYRPEGRTAPRRQRKRRPCPESLPMYVRHPTRCGSSSGWKAMLPR